MHFILESKIHIKSQEFLKEIACEIPDKAIKLANKLWPGPLTLVLKKQSHILDIVTSGKDTVGVRVPNHPLMLKLLSQLDFPLAAPSANPFGSISPTSAKHVPNYFTKALDVILDGGECTLGVESTVIGFYGGQPVLYRHGAISVEQIEKIVGKLVAMTASDGKPTDPGMLSRHYAPYTFLTHNIIDLVKKFEGKKIDLLLYKN